MVFDGLTALAAQVCGTPMAFVALVDQGRQSLKSVTGLSVREASSAIAFCDHTIDAEAPLVVEDASVDRRFAENPLVLGSAGIRFYAGMPLISAEGAVLGTIAVIDTRARVLTGEQAQALTLLAGQAVMLKELHRERNQHLRAARRLGVARQASQAPIAPVRFYLENSPLAVIEWDSEFRVRSWSLRAESMFGWSEEEVLGRHPTEWDFVHPDDAAAVGARIEELLAGRVLRFVHSNRNLARDGRQLYTEWYNSVQLDEAGHPCLIFSLVDDVTERRHLDALLLDREAQLRRAQKLEALGQLTGGIAHDFGNVLTVIMCNAELLQNQLCDNEHLARLAGMIGLAGARGSELTRRLLAFARPQPLQPKPVNLGRQIVSMQGLLGRTLGEHIAIELMGSPSRWRTPVDAGQFDNALLNLSLNARDAMPEGGTLTISTDEVNATEDHAVAQAGLMPGEYVRVTVADTGCGIPKAVLPHVFEPFFTTKEDASGSGLGLSMVYDFINQSEGHISLRSREGQGLVVEMYLPRATAGTEQADEEMFVPQQLQRGAECILLVEDDPLVREFASAQLISLGYHVLQACDGPEALGLMGRNEHIDLLFTDVVMPRGMNGRQLAQAALAIRPDLKVLYTSGYSADFLAHEGGVDPDVVLLPKPYGRYALAHRIRVVLDTPRRA